ncbi:amidohydrolase family protein [Micromonospora sp. NPDC005113]
MAIIDVHSHFVPEGCTDLRAPGPGYLAGCHHDLAAGTVTIDGHLRRLGDASEQPWMSLDPSPLTSASARLNLVQAAGLDRQVLSPPPYLSLYEAETSTAWPLIRRLNEQLADVVAGSDRFLGFCTVPLQDPALAARELEYAVGSLGFAGVQLLTHVNGEDLDAVSLIPFWAAVAGLDVPVFLHPHRPTDARRLSRQYLVNLVGNPAETAVAAAHLIFGGVLDRHPDLRVILAHGGGSVPSMWHRWKHASACIPQAWTARDDFDGYLDNFWFDSVVYDPGALTRLVEFAGAGRVVIGTDMPYDMGEPQPVRKLDGCRFDPDTRAAILDSSALFTQRRPADRIGVR